MTPNMLFIFLGIAFVLWFIARAYETGGGVVGMLMRRFLAQSCFAKVHRDFSYRVLCQRRFQA